MRVHVQNDPADPAFAITAAQWQAAAEGEPPHAVSFAAGPDGLAAAEATMELLVAPPPVLRRLHPLTAPRLRLVFVNAAGVDALAPFDWLPDGVVAAQQPRHARAEGGRIRGDGGTDAGRPHAGAVRRAARRPLAADPQRHPGRAARAHRRHRRPGQRRRAGAARARHAHHRGQHERPAASGFRRRGACGRARHAAAAGRHPGPGLPADAGDAPPDRPPPARAAAGAGGAREHRARRIAGAGRAVRGAGAGAAVRRGARRGHARAAAGRPSALDARRT